MPPAKPSRRDSKNSTLHVLSRDNLWCTIERLWGAWSGGCEAMVEGGSEEKAEQALRGSLSATERFGRLAGQDTKLSWRNHLSAKNVLQDELGQFGEYEGQRYTLTEDERDLLLTHGREDAAWSAMNAAQTLDAIEGFQRSLRAVKRLLWFLVLAVLALAFTLVSQQAAAADLEGAVTHVRDGDTIEVEGIAARLSGRPAGPRAK